MTTRAVAMDVARSLAYASGWDVVASFGQRHYINSLGSEVQSQPDA